MMLFILLVSIAVLVFVLVSEKKYKQLESEVLKKLGFYSWNIVSNFDEQVTVKSRQTLEKYDDIKFFKDNREKFSQAERVLKRKREVATILSEFLKDNEYKSNSQYKRLVKQINVVLENAAAYRIKVDYITSSGNNLASKVINITFFIILFLSSIL